MTPREALDVLKGNADAFIDHWLGDDWVTEKRKARAEELRVQEAYETLEKLV